MISYIIQALFHKKFREIRMNKKRNDKESLVCLTLKSSKKKKFRNNWSFLKAFFKL